MKITDIVLTTDQICGNSEGIALVLGSSQGYEYKDGKRTENVTHTKVEAVMDANRYEKLNVKVERIKIGLNNEQIAQQGGVVKVKFKNLSGKFYRMNSGEYALSCSADNVEIVG